MMTKREEIREGIHDLIGNCLIEIGCGEGGCPKAERQALDAQEALLEKLIEYLHSQGVVIKVDRGLPNGLHMPGDFRHPNWLSGAEVKIIMDLAVEPLIDSVRDNDTIES